MRFTFVVEAEVERTQGKFATREELAEQIQAELEGADPGSLEGENGGEYEVTSFEVSPQDEAPKPKREALTEVMFHVWAHRLIRLGASMEQMVDARKEGKA